MRRTREGQEEWRKKGRRKRKRKDGEEVEEQGLRSKEQEGKDSRRVEGGREWVEKEVAEELEEN